MSGKNRRQIAHAWVDPADSESNAKVVVFEVPPMCRHGFEVMVRDERELEYELQAICVEEVERLLIDLFATDVVSGSEDGYSDVHEEMLQRLMTQVESKASTKEYELPSDSL